MTSRDNPADPAPLARLRSEAFDPHCPAAAAAPATSVRSITSDQLFGSFPEVQISHGEAVYRLRRTALGKLILTK
jgi:hemin uptake protein HemP